VFNLGSTIAKGSEMICLCIVLCYDMKSAHYKTRQKKPDERDIENVTDNWDGSIRPRNSHETRSLLDLANDSVRGVAGDDLRGGERLVVSVVTNVR
jgi:hypothetical protein